MTDKEILNEVYGKLTRAAKLPSTQDAFVVRGFIEQEWQRRDEIEAELDKSERKERGG
jgi:hypothetical protein